VGAPSITYTFSNSTTADATQVNQNFTDIINGITDGTKDLSISALTCAGNVNLNANVTLGNASGDDITVTGSLASSIPIKTTNTYNIGSSSLGLAAVFFGANSQTVNIKGSASMSATWTFTLPVTAGTANYFLKTDGAGVTSWATTSLNSCSRVNTPNGHGSTNNKIRRFTNVDLSTSDITYADSAANGGSWTINTAGLYAITYVDRNVSAITTRFGVSVNSSVLTTDIASITYAQGYRAMTGATTATEYSSCSITLYLAVNDVVRAHTGGLIDSTDTNSVFIITRIS